MIIENTRKSIARWHEMLETRDMSILNELLAEEVVFRSPVAFQPYPGKQVVFFILTNVIQVFENFTYHREFISEDGNNVVLEFSANVGDKKLKGVDMIQFNEEGQMIDFEVMIRPKSGLEALAVQMGQRMQSFQAKT
ncbi:nuclear transport factor 2 family protein [Acinetobacter lwoffii]|uniref:Nuclear transport factor 2 family protein n=1 Tax=Acinetobacter lwoffii TaxID=28090 RepID=A0A646MUK0_ACILW|nr:nuclear transport factor 2 family protein [Acinetobacter lwoffii]MCU4616349.1 nuclear transport factor 2 family protein [Acinetobacter lwoffii]MDP1318399.1 nuclear transport factor 2 family protein [Acinetobacter lwoffii]MDP1372090.1 nuclear transport factor 2 family protein [Acinetobacter lwoffii]MDP1391535.1 nuclear transport factor 2 family protein [Acinetobacter lwoffii]MDP1449209.1 nuclear transport factor 2 family protein [Acinetobacter lwoffii]